MLRNTLGNIVSMLRAETGSSSASSQGNDYLLYLQTLIKGQNEQLLESHDWAFMRVSNEDATKVLQAGERYYDFPVAMSLHGTIDAEVYYNNIWLPLEYGIGPPEYSAFNSDIGVRAEPPLKWRIRSERQFEIWPIPDSDQTFSVRFSGVRLPTPVTGNDSPVDFDDWCIVWFCAAEILAKRDQKDADLKLAKAQARLTSLKAMYSDRRKIRIGMGDSARNPRLNNTVLVYRSYSASN